MKQIKCVNCGEYTGIDLANACDENGEVFMCKHCGFKFRYTKT